MGVLNKGLPVKFLVGILLGSSHIGSNFSDEHKISVKLSHGKPMIEEVFCVLHILLIQVLRVTH